MTDRRAARGDPDAERRFGLRTTYEGPEYPNFIAVGNDAVEFGLSRRPGADPPTSQLTWQLGVSEIDAAIGACEQAGLAFEVIVERPREDWSCWVVKVGSPNEMQVLRAASAAFTNDPRPTKLIMRTLREERPRKRAYARHRWREGMELG